MIRKDAGWRLVLAAATPAVAAVICLAGCGGSSGVTGTSPAANPGSPAAGPSTATPASSGGATSLQHSKLYYLTKLSKVQLCGLLHAGEPAQILGAATGPGTYTSYFGLGITCIWTKAGGNGELYVGISTVADWQAAQGIDKVTGATRTTSADGHPAESGGPHATLSYALVHVATGGAHDPAVEFRAPTAAIALKLAQTVMPRLLAISSSG